MCPEVVSLGEPMVEFCATSVGRLGEVPLFKRGWGGDTSNFAVAALQRDAVAAGADDFAIGNADGLHRIELRQRAAGRQLTAATVEREAGERNIVRVSA